MLSITRPLLSLFGRLGVAGGTRGFQGWLSTDLRRQKGSFVMTWLDSFLAPDSGGGVPCGMIHELRASNMTFSSASTNRCGSVLKLILVVIRLCLLGKARPLYYLTLETITFIDKNYDVSVF